MANLHSAVATPNYKVLEHFNDFADSWVHELVDHSPRIDPADGHEGTLVLLTLHVPHSLHGEEDSKHV